MKPLFIPLARRWFDAFSRGEKTVEYRRLGGPWNERTCVPGRRVVLSRGYGRHARLTGVITRFAIVSATRAPEAARAIYPDADRFAAISIALD